MKKELTQEEKDYINAFLDLYHLHKTIFGEGKHPNMPSLFSEKVCRRLLKLSKCNGRAFDAIDFSKETVEIKGTCLPGTQTTFSDKTADRYIWFKLIPDSKSIEIIELNRKELLKKIKPNEKGKRVTINMNSLNGNKVIMTLKV